MICLQSVKGLIASLEHFLSNSNIVMKIIMTIVFLQMTWSVGFKHDCHKNCVCIIWKKLAICLAQNLSRLPDDIPAYYTNVNLKNNSISSLLAGDFEKAALLHLNTLDLSFCNLRTIQSGAFHGMTLLVELNLSNNYIETLHSNTFCGATSLAELSLASNLIHTVQPTAFCGICNLKMLNLKNNSISKMEEHMFGSLTGLTGLSLRGNYITQVPDKIFVDLKNLTFLDLSLNSISTITKASLIDLERLIALYLPNNSLHCDCDLRTTFLWLAERSVSVIAECSAPRQAYGLSWQVMLSVGCNGTAIQDITTTLPDTSMSQEADTSLLVYVLTVFATLTVLLAIAINLYKFVVGYQQKKQHLVSSQRYRASTQTIETES